MNTENSHIVKFDIILTTDKEKQQRGGKDDKNNNCFYYACCPIIKEFFSEPSFLKAFLKIKQNAMVDVSNIDGIEEKMKVGIYICGDVDRVPKSEYKRNIHIKLFNGHYTSFYNPHSEFSMFEFKEPKTFRVWKQTAKNDFLYYDGKSMENYTTKQRNNDYIDVKFEEIQKMGGLDIKTLADARKYLYEQIDLVSKYTDNEIDMRKTGWTNRCFLLKFWENFYKHQQGIKFEPIEPYEVRFLEGCSGQQQFVKAGKYPIVVSYDGISWYPALLLNKEFFIPFGQGKLMNKNTKDIAKSQNGRYSYGIYHCVVEYKDEMKFKFKYNPDKNYYTHYDLHSAFECGLKITMVDEEYNFLAYPKEKLIKSHKIFEDTLGFFVDLKVKHPDCKIFKLLSSRTWGILSQYKKIYVKSDKDGIVETPVDTEYIIKDFHHDIKDNKNEYTIVDKCSPYRYPTARIKPFILSYGRREMFTRVLNKYDSIVKLQTDGFLSSEPIPEFENNTSHNIGEIIKKDEQHNIELKNMLRCEKF